MSPVPSFPQGSDSFPTIQNIVGERTLVVEATPGFVAGEKYFLSQRT